MDTQAAVEFIDSTWDESITPELVEYIKIPNKSPLFDPDWVKHGYMDQAVDQLRRWCERQALDDLQIEVVTLPGRTPVLFMEIRGEGDDCVLLYGHLDKQPEMSGWREDLGPWKPVIENGRLYGRGGADDGYSTFSAVTALRALVEQRVAHARCVILIEACEESGSYDLPYYIDALSDRIGNPSLVVCLDSGCGNYEQLWCTTSLRGTAGGTLTVKNLAEGVHSGDAGGIVPSTFRILRQLLSRLEDEDSGQVKLANLHVPIPEQRVSQASVVAQVLGSHIYDKFPFVQGAHAVTQDLKELVLNRTWRPALEITGAGGLPAIENAGNVARPETSVRLSMRIPPTCEPERASETIKTLLEANSPYGAQVTFEPETACVGWDAPPLADWLEKSAGKASQVYFGRPAVYMGEGGTIPFMGMLGEKFPSAQFLITGVLGPHSNAHGPNEFLHLQTAKHITCCVASVLADHFNRPR